MPRITRRQALATLPIILPTARKVLAAEPPESRSVNDAIRAAAGRARLSMLFEGSTRNDAVAWQTEFRNTLNRLLGTSQPPRTFRVKQEARSTQPDHTRHDLLLESPGTDSVPVSLLIPADWKPGQKRPGVLAVHGHGDHGHHPVAGRTDLQDVAAAIKTANYDYGLQLVRRGYVVVAPCMIPFGRRVDKTKYGGTDPCATTFVRMQALGTLSITANLRDLRWSLSLLQQRPEVDATRLGCAGLSYGGRMTMLVSAIDRRVKVAAISGALNLLQERIRGRYTCGSQVIPGLLEYGDYSEIGSLIAPRHAVWETGSTDPLIVKTWDTLFRDRLRKVYQAMGASNHLLFDRFEGGHRWNGQLAYPLFDKVLRG
jgi:dienelactone hydrolase